MDSTNKQNQNIDDIKILLFVLKHHNIDVFKFVLKKITNTRPKNPLNLYHLFDATNIFEYLNLENNGDGGAIDISCNVDNTLMKYNPILEYFILNMSCLDIEYLFEDINNTDEDINVILYNTVLKIIFEYKNRLPNIIYSNISFILDKLSIDNTDLIHTIYILGKLSLNKKIIGLAINLLRNFYAKNICLQFNWKHLKFLYDNINFSEYEQLKL